MKKVLWLIFCIAAAAGLGAQTLSITAAPSPPTIIFTSNTNLQTTGYFTLKLSDTQSTYYAYSDVSPNVGYRKTWYKFQNRSTSITIPFEVYENSSFSSSAIIYTGDTNRENVSELYKYTFAGAGTVTLPYYVRIPAISKTLSPGVYESTITLGTWLTNNQTKLPKSRSDTTSVVLSLVVTPQSSITISTNDSSGNVVFGDISTESTGSKTFTVTIRSNYRYSLRVSSANGGKLLNPDAGGTESISYTMNIASVTPDLSVAGVQKDILLNQDYTGNDTSSGGDTYSGTVTLGAINAFTAGEYSDTLTFTISSQ
ncbi:MAG: hypothetical protein ABFC85_04330 [Rectinema sp.]